MKNTEAEICQILKAAIEGKKIEWHNYHDKTWYPKNGNDYWDFKNNQYRIAREPRKLYVIERNGALGGVNFEDPQVANTVEAFGTKEPGKRIITFVEVLEPNEDKKANCL